MTLPVGVQSFTYREFDVDGLQDALTDTGIQAIEPYHSHLGVEADTSEIASFRDRFESIGIEVCGYGVVGFDAPDDVEKTLAFADRLGVSYVSIDVDPADDDTLDALVAAAADRDLRLGIHNHGPGHRYSTVEDVKHVLDRYPDAPHLGACVDTGHFFRSDEQPGDVIPALGDRIHAVHLKDFVDEDTEVIPGDGQLNIPEVLGLLDDVGFDQPLVIEYEEDADDPTPAIETVVRRIEAAQR